MSEEDCQINTQEQNHESLDSVNNASFATSDMLVYR